MERGLLSWRDFVDGPVTVVDAPRRNHNFKVTVGDEGGFFVKQVSHLSPQEIESVRRKATCHWLAHLDEELTELREMMPTYHEFDTQRHILVTALVVGETLHERGWQGEEAWPEATEHMGKLLARCHSVQLGELSRNMFPRLLPWVLRTDMLAAFQSQGESPATQQTAARVLADPVFHRGLSYAASR